MAGREIFGIFGGARVTVNSGGRGEYEIIDLVSLHGFKKIDSAGDVVAIIK